MSRNSRKLVFVNGLGETLTIETKPYLISKIDGLGIPSVDRQEQKAPYQDGTTYIDSLLQNRDISVEIDISSGPNNFTEIDTRRRELSQRLCPKYGPGTLTYTTEGGQSYTIAAVPYSVVFPNKDYRGPYARALITFTCNDPYWKKTTASGITLPTSETSATSLIATVYSVGSAIILQADGVFRAVYIRSSDNYIVQRTSADGVTWSAESVISSAIGYNVKILEQSDGAFLVMYNRSSDRYLVQRTSADGVTWSAESVVVSENTNVFSLIQEKSGSFRVVRGRFADNYIVQRTSADGVTWSADSVITSSANAAYPSLYQSADGLLRVLHRDGNPSLLVQKTSVDGVTWSSAKTVSSTVNSDSAPRLYQLDDGTFRVVYRAVTTGYIVQRYSYDGETWSSESVVYAALANYPQLIQLSSTSLYFTFTSGSALLYSTRSVTPIPATIAGDVSTPCQITFNGPSVNPRIWHQEKLEYLYFNLTLASGDSMVIDTSFGNKTVQLTQGGIVKNGIAYLDISSTFFQLDRGTNTVYYEDDSVASTATATMAWTERYVGI